MADNHHTTEIQNHIILFIAYDPVNRSDGTQADFIHH